MDRKAVAKETLRIMEQGYYEIEGKKFEQPHTPSPARTGGDPRHRLFPTHPAIYRSGNGRKRFAREHMPLFGRKRNEVMHRQRSHGSGDDKPCAQRPRRGPRLRTP